MRTAPTSGGTRVAAVMAAYNRRELTLACLRSLGAQQVPGVALDVFVLDDASSDGTSEVAEQFPEVTVLHGDGELYWNGGMRRAIAGDYDYYLITHLLSLHPQSRHPIHTHPYGAPPPPLWVTSTTGFAPGRPAARSGSLPRRSGPARPIPSAAQTNSPWGRSCGASGR